MSFTIKKSFFYQLLLFICVAVPLLNVYEVTFAIWLTALFITIQIKYSTFIVKQAFIYSLIILIAFLSAINSQTKTFYYFKDIAYLAKPVIGLLLGYQLFRGIKNKALISIINTGLLIASIHILLVIETFISGHARTLATLREDCGYFNDFEVYVLILLIFHKKFNIEIPKRKLQIFISIMILSAFFYFARTNFIQFIILYIGLKGYLKINKKSITIVSVIILLSVTGYAIIYNLNPKRDGTGVEQFLYKIKNAPIEPFKTKIDVTNWKDLNDNYRSYENILTIKQVTGKGLKTIIIGEGLGSSVDLKQKIWLQSSYMRYIPFLHNSYMTAYLKSGLLGVVLLLFYIYMLLTVGKSKNYLSENINLLLIGSGVFLIISNWVFLGLYNLLEAKSLLLGFLIAYKEFVAKKEKLNE